MTGSIEISVRLDARTFRRYCAFDALRRQRRWYWPALLTMLLITGALAGLFGWIPMNDVFPGLLMGLGLAVPMLNLGLYFIPIEAQIASQHLKEAPLIYTLLLDDTGVSITNEQKKEAPVDLSWDRLWAAFKQQGDIYLYVNPERALILPEGQTGVSPEILWSFLQTKLGVEKCVDSKGGSLKGSAKR